MIPVSYTHLDVYKRQILDSFADRIGNDTWKTVITQEGLLTVQALLRRTATKSTAVAVSYTHLDVYKRQVHECNIDDTISFTDTTYIGDWDKKFYLPKDIILGLIASIKQ